MVDLVPKLLSVVVPIYNVGSYLRDCLDSLRSQTYRELQVILVDDGSTDDSAAVAEEYVARDSRFQLIRQANAGLSEARNTGIPYATGAYLAFLDSDDVLASYAYEVLIGAAEATGSPLAVGSVHRLTSRGHYLGYPHNDVFRSTNLRTHVSTQQELLRDRTIWNKVFDKSFYDEHGFRFPAGRLYEDAPVSLPAHALASQVSVVNLPIYFWRAREGVDRSITQLDNDVRNVRDRFHSVNLVRASFAESGHHELRRVYQECAVWDELSNYLKFLPTATEEYQNTYLDLANEYLDDIGGPAVIDRLPRMRPHWRAIRARDLDALMEVVDTEFRPAAVKRAVPRSGLSSGITAIDWRDGKLHVEGYAYPDRRGMARPWSAARLFWLRESRTRRLRMVSSMPRRVSGPVAEGADPGRSYAWSGFSATIDPATLRHGGTWRSGSWTFAAAATDGTKLRRDGLRMGTEPLVLTAREVAPGVRVVPAVSHGVLQIRVTATETRVTGLRRVGDDLEITAESSVAVGADPVFSLAFVEGLPAVSAAATATVGENGRTTLVGRLPLDRIGLVDDSHNHVRGLFRRRLLVELGWQGSKSAHLATAQDLAPVRLPFGSDEIYSHTSMAGYLYIDTRPVGPVVTGAQWQPDGSLLLTGDTSGPAASELVLRVRGRRRDIGVPVVTEGTSWQAVIRPDAQLVAGAVVEMVPGLWDISYRPAGAPYDVTPPLGFADELLHTLPLTGEAPNGVRNHVEAVGGCRGAVRIGVELPPADRGADGQQRLRRAYTEQHGPLRDVLLVDGAEGRRYPDDLIAVVDEVVGRAGAPRVLWTAEQGESVPGNVERLALHSAAWYDALATSRWVLTNDDLPAFFRRRDGQTVLHLAQGWPVRRFGAGAVGHPLGASLLEQLAADTVRWSALVSPGPRATTVLRREYGYTGEVLEFGRPSAGLLLPERRAELRATVLDRLGVDPAKRVALYLPTWRTQEMRQQGWSNPGRLLDLPKVADGLDDDTVLLARRHPGLRDDISGSQGRVPDVSRYLNTAELMAAADVLITDYSSTLVDFAATGRPILVYAPDLEVFSRAPGLEIDLRAEAPGPLLTDSAEVVAALRDLDAVAAEHEAAYKAFADRYVESGDGGAAARVADWLLARA
jgi:CDP-glycerol glycerophosphotransferase